MITINGNPTTINNNFLNTTYTVPKGEPPVVFSAYNLTGTFGESFPGNYWWYTYTINGLTLTAWYYTYNKAIRIADSIEGWHLPTLEEWKALFDYYGDAANICLKSTSGWNNGLNGLDTNNLHFYPVGWASTRDHYDAGSYCRYYTTSSYNSSQVYTPYIGTNGVVLSSHGSTEWMYPVRLVKDY
jgi:uncharacterized protein (TIGR02145 family)